MRIQLLIFLYIISIPAFGIDFPLRPDPPRLVNDLAGMMSKDEADIIENKLVAFDDSTSIQIAVVTVTSLDGYPIDDYAFKLAEQWGIGQKETSNGVLLLISKNERKMFIATGYGMEGIMPDALCKRIITNDITPPFKRQQYFEGIDEGTTQMMLLAKGEYKGKGRVKSKAPFLGFGVVLFVLFIIFMTRFRSAKSYGSLNNIPWWVAWTLLNSGRRSGSGWGNFNSGSGSFGGGSSGGFGGFGGGSFGGGGAGGSW